MTGAWLTGCQARAWHLGGTWVAPAWLLAGTCLFAVACGGPRASAAGSAAPPAAGASSGSQSPTAIPHGDHNPRFGGVVYMNGDVHFEVVIGRDGRHHVYFSDAVRNELPAATATGVTITIMQKGRAPDVIPLAIDESGESWAGQGPRINDPDASARVAYAIHGAPYFIDVPVPK
jgi:hypothetical protein